MELNYMVRGADGKEYGPASLEQLIAWIGEGRLPAQHQVRRSDMEHWASAGDFLELQPAFASDSGASALSVTASAAAATPQDAALIGQLKSGASWFYWIAGLSLINSIAAFSGSTWRFIVGLGITQIFDGFGISLGGAGKAVALVFDLLVAGVFVLFGVFAHKAHTWAFVVGIALFALDGLIFVVAQDWLGVGFHVFVLYWLFRGFKACRAAKSSSEGDMPAKAGA